MSFDILHCIKRLTFDKANARQIAAMVEHSIDRIRQLMGCPVNVRNISAIFEPFPGTPNVVTLLGKQSGIRLSAAEDRQVIWMEDQIHHIDTKSVPIPLYARHHHTASPDSDSKEPFTDEFLINLIDCSDHVRLMPSAGCPSLRNTDGVIVVVDCITGISSRVEKVFRQALDAYLKPVIFFDNLEKALLDAGVSLEDLYQLLLETIQMLNGIISQHVVGKTGDPELCPAKSNIIFGSSEHGWAFTINQFASKYVKNFDVELEKLSRRLWGDSFFHTADNKWRETGDESQRSFNQFVLGPISRLYKAYRLDDSEALATLATKLEIQLTVSENGQTPTDLLKTMIQKFLPAEDAFMSAVIEHVPSPIAAQESRAETLYLGDTKDDVCDSIKACKSDADVLLLVSNVIPAQDKKTSYVICRVFSGTVRNGLKIRIQGEGYVSGKPSHLYIKAMQTPAVIIGRTVISIQEIPAGNFACITGIAEYVDKGGTITTWECAENMKWASRGITSIVRCTVDVKNPNDLPHLVDGLKKLIKCDTAIETSLTESGNHILMGLNEQHLKTRCQELEDHYAGVPLEVSEQFIGYRESVHAESSMTALSKSPNKFCRFWVSAEPLGDVTTAIEEGRIGPSNDVEARARILADEFSWDENDARKIWAFGPGNDGPNLLVDMTSRIQYLNEVKDSFISGFQWATREGPIMEEPLWSVRMNIVDVTLFSDAIHRGAGQVIPAARRVSYAATLLADPFISESVHEVEVRAPSRMTDQVISVFDQRDGRVFFQQEQLGGFAPTSLVKAYVPVLNSFGLTKALQEATGIPIFPSIGFGHWQAVLGGSPLIPTTTAGKIATNLRRLKGLKEEVPEYTLFYDKL